MSGFFESGSQITNSTGILCCLAFGCFEIVVSAVGLYILLTAFAVNLRLPSTCLVLALGSKFAYLVCVAVLWDVLHGFELALASVAGHVTALVGVSAVGAWIARAACHAERVLILEEVLVIRSLSLGPGSSGADPKFAMASFRILLILMHYHFRVGRQRALEFNEWEGAPERHWLSGLISILIVASAAFLVGLPRFDDH